MFQSKKPYSAVTVAVENLTSEHYEEDDFSGIPDLVEAIGLQATGPAEAARAIRKKLKYGNVHQQLRALTILDGLIENAGARFQRTFADEMLLERLRVCGTSDLTPLSVKDKCKELFRGWTVHKNTPGLEQIAGLYKQLPRHKQVVTQDRSKVLRETEQNPFDAEEDEEEVSKPSSHSRQASLASSQAQSSRSSTPPSSFFSSSTAAAAKKSKKDKDKGKKKKPKPFNLEAEKETMKGCIGEASVASTNLLNALRTINREREQISENQNAVHHFEFCKLLRRKILRYILNVEAEEWLGALLHANDELVTALMTFEQLDRSIDADSDSDDELAEQQHMYKVMSDRGKENEALAQLSGLHIDKKSPSSEGKRPPPPPRPTARAPPPVEDEDSEIEEDENDPFADRNALQTPNVEKDEPRWREV